MARSAGDDAGRGDGRAEVSLEAAIVARRYYLDGKQKNEIATELGISRFKVARLLDEALSTGIVHISIDMPTEIDLPAGEKLAKAYGIDRAIIVRTLEEAPVATGSLLGAAGAEYLHTVLESDDVLGISWGASLTHVVDAVSALPPADIVQLVGGVHSADMAVNGVELLRRLAAKTGGRAYPLHVPLLVRTKEIAAELRGDPSLARTIDSFGSLSVALVGIGSWNPARSSLYTELSAADRNSLLARGAVADLCTFVLASDGTPIDAPELERTIGLSLEELRRIPEVIAVAGGAEKVDAIAAVLRSKLVTVLVTDSVTAASLLDAV